MDTSQKQMLIASDQTSVCFPPGYERVVASRVQRVDVTARIVKQPVPEVFGELEGDFPLG